MRKDNDIVFGLEMPDERPLSQSPIPTYTNSTLLDLSTHLTSRSTLPSQTKKSLSQHTQNKAHGFKNPSLKLKGKEKALKDPGNPRMGNYYKEKIIVLLDITIREIKATPTHIMGWFEEELMKA